MIAVIFEVSLNESGTRKYFEIAEALKSHLVNIEGFISVERFVSVADSNRYVSLSFWQNESSVKQWRDHFLHSQAQAKGIQELFDDYRIRVVYVERDYDMTSRQTTK